jgi:hypothetical protein
MRRNRQGAESVLRVTLFSGLDLNGTKAHGHTVIVPGFRRPKLRILNLALVGALALSAATVAHADPLDSKMRPAGPSPGTFQLGGGGPGGQPVLDGRGASRHPMPGNPTQWREWAGPHWTPQRYYGAWGPPMAWGGPFIVWGGPYVPYRAYGDWGALWYPYAEWREPHGGWGNP